MGRFGGRGGARHGREHNTVEVCHSLTPSGYYQRALMGHPDKTFEIGYFVDGDEAHLLYCHHGTRRAQTIAFDYTSCHFGGKRRWFICPRCRRRVGKIFLPNFPSAGYWYCRHCYDLTYVQRQERAMKWWTFNGRAQRIAERWLIIRQGDATIYKPKWQRWKTYRQRARQYLDLSSRANLECAAGLMSLSMFRRSSPDLVAQFKKTLQTARR